MRLQNKMELTHCSFGIIALVFILSILGFCFWLVYKLRVVQKRFCPGIVLVESWSCLISATVSLSLDQSDVRACAMQMNSWTKVIDVDQFCKFSYFGRTTLQTKSI